MQDDELSLLASLSLAEPTTPIRNDANDATTRSVTPEKLSSSMRTPEKPLGTPGSLPQPYVIRPAPNEHAATLIMLHGFTDSGKSYGSGWMPTLRQKAGDKLKRLKVVWLNAPVRTASCYKDHPRVPAWHDYFTDHGGEEGRPEVEEEIDVKQLEWSRARVHAVIDAEAQALAGDYGRIAIGGASQGCCTALDAALTHPRGSELAGVFASCGQVYSCTPIPRDRLDLPIVAFHGAADRCIAASLALRSYATLIDAGFRAIWLHVEPNLGHCEPNEAEGSLLVQALHRWGFFEYVPLEAQRREPASPEANQVRPAQTSEASTTPTQAASRPADQTPSPASTPPSSSNGRHRQRHRRSGERRASAAGADRHRGGDAEARMPVLPEAEGELEILKAWYGDGDNVWSEAEGSGSDVTAPARRFVRCGELRLNEARKPGWYNERFGDRAPGTWKVMAVRFRYGNGATQEVVSPKKSNERSSLIITPARCSPRPVPSDSLEVDAEK
jgi:predicted esterase